MNNDYKKIVFVAVMSLALAFLLVFAGLFKKAVNTNNVPIVSAPTANYEVNDSNWKKYQTKTSNLIEFDYPNGFNVGGSGGIDGESTLIEIKNFQWNKNAYGFPYIDYESKRFYMEIFSSINDKNLQIKDWITEKDYPEPEKVQIIEEYNPINGNIISEKDFTISGMPALQRIVKYSGLKGEISIIYSYVNFNNQIYQFIGHFSSNENIIIYNKIVSSFKFIEKDEIADWKTYRNEDYEFEIKYPMENWIISEYQDDNCFTIIDNDQQNCIYLEYANNNVKIIISISNFSAKQNLDNYLGNIPEGIRPEAEKVLLNDIKGYNVDDSTSLGEVQEAGESLYLEKNSESSFIINFLYSINNNSLCINEKAYYCHNIIKKIISTFRFIEKDETANWKIYKSEKFGIEFNYPPELFITEENQGTSENYDEMDLLFTNIENKSLISATTITKWKTTKPVFTPEEAGTFYEKLAFYSWYYFFENKNQIKTGGCSAEVQENLPDLPTLQEQTACEIQVQPTYIKITTNGQIIFYTSTLEITLPFEEKNEDIISKIALSFRFNQ